MDLPSPGRRALRRLPSLTTEDFSPAKRLDFDHRVRPSTVPDSTRRTRQRHKVYGQTPSRNQTAEDQLEQERDLNGNQNDFAGASRPQLFRSVSEPHGARVSRGGGYPAASASPIKASSPAEGRRFLPSISNPGYPPSRTPVKKQPERNLKALSGAHLFHAAIATKDRQTDAGVALFHAALLSTELPSPARSSFHPSASPESVGRRRGASRSGSSPALGSPHCSKDAPRSHVPEVASPSILDKNQWRRLEESNGGQNPLKAVKQDEVRVAAMDTMTSSRETDRSKIQIQALPLPVDRKRLDASKSDITDLECSFSGTLSSKQAIRGEKFVWVKGQVIGCGSLGTVYEGLDQSTGRILAVKEIRIDDKNDTDKKFKAELENEIDICQDLKHPHIVSYLGHDTVDNRLYVYLEYMTGGSVAQVLSQYGPFAEELIQRYARELLEGLQYLHTRKPNLILHRDIKGANILVGDGKVKLADFGCSKRTADTLSQTMRGSIPWMAPEVIMSSGYGRRSDIWSFGCAIIEMATAKLPWGGFDNPMAGMRRIGFSNEVPAVPDHLSAECQDFLSQCCIRDKTIRPLASALLQHSFVRHVDTTRSPDESLSALIFGTSLSKSLSDGLAYGNPSPSSAPSEAGTIAPDEALEAEIERSQQQKVLSSSLTKRLPAEP